MIKLIASDLDGTLLDHDKKVAQREMDALLNVKNSDVQLCLASGRMHAEMRQVLEEIDHEAYIVSQNGAFIHLADGALLQAKYFETALAQRVFHMIQEVEAVKLFCSGEANHISQLSPASDAIQARLFEQFVLTESLANALHESFPICKFSLFGELGPLLVLKEQLQQELGDLVDVYIADKDCLDIMPRTVSKGTSLLVLAKELGIQAEEIACVGDSFNDVSMFGITPHSFAMSSAHPDVKKQASHQVDSVSEVIHYVMTYNENKLKEQRGSAQS
ncbi:Cof-type HAD-IIB family hydrolase [Paenibacillus whitsoniae]|uniref:Cof-type HAD-IIB family hydrolase n=1 Tax=Paenibacillus whitsoniae TaxID=2496558 RepID=A0A3S0CPX9_9BACL|nr:Cof-type HAD-IIB family hydrolase [Paenibacillus whitsoniae]RTE02235.1 Cof-type HAD-IIB family hydrolase [Paenibacillus whitsoniae]